MYDCPANSLPANLCVLQRAACGLGGLVIAMLVETVLLMIETNRFEGPKLTSRQLQEMSSGTSGPQSRAKKQQ